MNFVTRINSPAFTSLLIILCSCKRELGGDQGSSHQPEGPALPLLVPTSGGSARLRAEEDGHHSPQAPSPPGTEVCRGTGSYFICADSQPAPPPSLPVLGCQSPSTCSVGSPRLSTPTCANNGERPAGSLTPFPPASGPNPLLLLNQREPSACCLRPHTSCASSSQRSRFPADGLLLHTAHPHSRRHPAGAHSHAEQRPALQPHATCHGSQALPPSQPPLVLSDLCDPRPSQHQRRALWWGSVFLQKQSLETVTAFSGGKWGAAHSGGASGAVSVGLAGRPDTPLSASQFHR